jgi:seryl-tRNA synthetase
MYRNEWFETKDFPIRFAGISPCFRKEAGAHGKDTWGIFRVHQFEKVEQFCITTPEESSKMHEEMIAVSEEF